MYNVGNLYLENMQNGKYDPNRNITGTITLTNGSVLNIDSSKLKTNSLTIDCQCASSSLEIGTATINKCNFEFNTDLYIYDLYDAEIKLYYHAWNEDIPLGIYYITEATRQTTNWLKITAYDAMNKTEESIGNLSTNGHAFAVLSWIGNQCGIELANTQEEIEAMRNGDVVLNISSNVYSTYHDALKDLAGVLGGIATIDRNGRLKIVQYNDSPAYTLSNNERISSTVSEYQTYISEIDFTVDSIEYKSTTSQNDGLTYSLSNKMIKGLVSTVQPIVDNILDAVKNVKYTPTSIQILYNPIFDLGDMIHINADNKTIKKNINTVITGFTFTMQGTSKIVSVGESIFLSKRSKSKAQTAADSSSAIAKNNGTYIETYENIENYNVGTTRTKIVSIDYANGSADVIVMHGQACINCTTAGTIKLIYGHDGNDETFSPKHLLQVGYNTIEFYCYFLKPEENWLSSYTVDIVSDDAEGTISIGDIRADVMATMIGNGRFIVDNVFEENIPFYNRDETLTNYLIGTEDPYAEDEDEQN